MKRVFILGAGFSVPAGFPVIEDLFLKLRQFYFEELREQNLQCLQEFENERVEVENLICPSGELENNFEKFISLLDSGIEAEMLSQRYAHVRKGWLLILTFFLHSKLLSIQNDNFYNSFFKKINSHQDIILTFNWDTLLEYILNKNNIAWQYRNTQGYSGKDLTIYKLHGSINWFFLVSSLRPGSGNILKELQTDDITKGKPYWYDKDDLEKAIDQIELQTDSIPFIVPPTYLKKYESGMKLLWSGAFDELKSANEIYVIGYSFPEFDFFSELTFRLSVSNNRLLNLEDGTYVREVKLGIFDKNKKVFEKIKLMIGSLGIRFVEKEVDFLLLDSWDRFF